MKKIQLYLSLIALTVFSNACGSEKPSGNSTGPVVEKAKLTKKTTTAKSKKVSFVVDDTGSYSGEQLQQPTIDLKSALIQAENVNFVDVSNIGGNGKQSWEPTRQQFDLSAKPMLEFNRAEAVEWAKKNGCGSRLMCLEREVERLRKQAESDYQGEFAAYQETRRNTVEKISEAILQSPIKSPVCSDIQEQAEFVAQLPVDTVIWLTDGQHNCKTALNGVEFKNKSVMLLVLPVNNEVSGNFGKRLEYLSAKFQNAQVKPVFSVNQEIMATFLAQ